MFKSGVLQCALKKHLSSIVTIKYIYIYTYFGYTYNFLNCGTVREFRGPLESGHLASNLKCCKCTCRCTCAVSMYRFMYRFMYGYVLRLQQTPLCLRTQPVNLKSKQLAVHWEVRARGLQHGRTNDYNRIYK